MNIYTINVDSVRKSGIVYQTKTTFLWVWFFSASESDDIILIA